VRALPFLLAAARRARTRFEHAHALAAYRQAREILADEPRPPELAAALWSARARWHDAPTQAVPAAVCDDAARAVHEGMGEGWLASGRYDAALASFDAAARLAATADARAVLLGKIADTRFARGELRVAARTLDEALGLAGVRVPESRLAVRRSIAASVLSAARRALPRGAFAEALRDPAARARAGLRVRLLNRLTHVNYSFDVERTLQTHLLALATAEQIPDTADAAVTFSHHGALLAGILPARGRRYVERAVAVCEREGHDEVRMVVGYMAGVCYLFQARWAPARAHLRRAIELFPRVGDVAALETAHENLSYLCLYEGAAAEALEHGEHALRLSRQVNDVRGLVTSLHHLALAHLQRGDLERAVDYAREARRALPELRDHVVHSMVHCGWGQIAQARGAAAEARASLREAVRLADVHGLTQEEVSPAYGALAALCAATDVRAAGRLVAAAKRAARRYPAHRGGALRAEGSVALAAGRRAHARACFEAALAAHEALAMRWEAAQTRALLASLR
jgi:tetratricopeptide (TPR) repeat protein